MATYLISAILGLTILAYPAIAGYATPPTPSEILPKGVVRVAEASELTNHDTEVPQQFDVWVTAYSSSPEETDSTPFVTAMNTQVRDGIVAANFLPMGTKIRIPAIFGEREFVVEDRMHRRKTDFVDVWMPTKEEAQHFGITRTVIEVLP